MHPSTLPQEVLNRVSARRGRAFAFPAIDARRTALVVIDMQNVFLAPGAVAEVPAAREIVDNINRLAATARARGAPVAWVQTELPADQPGGGWPVFMGEIVSAELAARYLEGLARGSEGHRLWSALQTHAGDLYVRKNRFSAFLPEASDLAEQLRARNVDTVLITGTLTNVCCESSARDAMMRNFRVILVGDANATRTDAEHMATLVTVHQSFGDVRSTEEAIGLLGAS